MYGDIAVKTGLQNADPCTAKGCKWPKAADGNVYVPFTIAKVYCECGSSVEPVRLESISEVRILESRIIR